MLDLVQKIRRLGLKSIIMDQILLQKTTNPGI